MEVLVLSWALGPDDTSGQVPAAGLATALADAGHGVRLVTRLPAGVEPPTVDGVEVHAVGDAPPIVPAALDTPDLSALAFAARATSVAVRRLEERPVDVVHADGWTAGPVVAALRHSHGVRVAAELDAAAVLADDTPGELARQLAADADVLLARSTRDVAALRTVGAAPTHTLPLGVTPPRRTPGPPPARGPVLLVPPQGTPQHAAARELRAALTTRRTITGARHRRPVAAVVLDPTDLRTVARSLAAGVPVVAADGPAADVVLDAGAGIVVRPTVAAAAAALDTLLADTDRTIALGAAAAAAAGEHAWPRVAEAWTGAVADVLRPSLHAAG